MYILHQVSHYDDPSFSDPFSIHNASPSTEHFAPGWRRLPESPVLQPAPKGTGVAWRLDSALRSGITPQVCIQHKCILHGVLGFEKYVFYILPCACAIPLIRHYLISASLLLGPILLLAAPGQSHLFSHPKKTCTWYLDSNMTQNSFAKFYVWSVIADLRAYPLQVKGQSLDI
jgi:hypothetical protein